MNIVNPAALRTGKNCFLAFRNKKINNFTGSDGIINSFASTGYYFDKISHVSYNSSEEIVRAVKDAKENYENIVIYCPSNMQNTLKSFITTLYAAEFNALGILKSYEGNVFMFLSDAENRLRFEDIKEILDLRYGIRLERAYVKTIWAPATVIETAIEQAKSVCPDMSFNVTDAYGNCSIEILYPCAISKDVYNEAMRRLLSKLNDFVYALEDISLAQMLFRLLKLRRMKISIAESFTGGGVGKALVDIPGISEVYYEGLNPYSNKSKIQRLGVNEITLKHYGAVSEETAREMAAGLINGGNCDISIATTGIAGPTSDNTAKPVGLCYIAVGTSENVSVYRYNLKGDRDTVTKTAINLALFLAYKTLK